jgi:hypothetical protein
VYLLKKRLLDDDKEAYKILEMLLEPIVSESSEKMKKEQGRQAEGEQSAMPISNSESRQNGISC